MNCNKTVVTFKCLFCSTKGVSFIMRGSEREDSVLQTCKLNALAACSFDEHFHRDLSLKRMFIPNRDFSIFSFLFE